MARFATRHELFFLLTTAAAIILCLVNKGEAQTGYVLLNFIIILLCMLKYKNIPIICIPGRDFDLINNILIIIWYFYSE